MTPTTVQPIKAHSKVDGRKPQNFQPGRRCAHPDCETLLSIYNRADVCHIHRPLRYPRRRW